MSTILPGMTFPSSSSLDWPPRLTLTYGVFRRSDRQMLGGRKLDLTFLWPSTGFIFEPQAAILACSTISSIRLSSRLYVIFWTTYCRPEVIITKNVRTVYVHRTGELIVCQRDRKLVMDSVARSRLPQAQDGI